MMAYEWKEEFVGNESLADVLNKLEADGWEVFQVLQHTEGGEAYGEPVVEVHESVIARKEIISKTCGNCANLVPAGPLFGTKCSEGFESVKVGADGVDCEKYVASE